MMNQVKFYKITTWGLALLNISILAFLMLTKPAPPRHHHPNHGFKSEVSKILKFDDGQQSMFLKLAEEHSQELRSISEKQQTIFNRYFESLVDTSTTHDNANNLTEFQQLEKEKFEVTRQHLLDVKKLLREDQLPHYEQFIQDFLEKTSRKVK